MKWNILKKRINWVNEQQCENDNLQFTVIQFTAIQSINNNYNKLESLCQQVHIFIVLNSHNRVEIDGNLAMKQIAVVFFDCCFTL